MAAISLQAAIGQLKAGKIAPVYFLPGKEKFFQDQFIGAAQKYLFPDKGSKDLNLTILYGSENTLSELISACMSYPMLAAQRLVLVRDFDKMKMTDADAFAKYLEHPQNTTCLVLSASEKGRAKIYTTLAKKAQTIDCTPIREYKIGGWISEHCREKGYAIDPQAVQFLIDLLGTSLLSLTQEINKIIDFKGDSSTITLDDLEQTTGISKEANVFTLQRALSRRQLKTSLKTAARLTDTGTDITALNAVLSAFFRKLLQAGSLKSKGKDRRETAELMHLHEFQLKDIYEALSHFNLRQIEQVIGFLHEADIAAKTSAADKNALVQMLCYQICKV